MQLITPQHGKYEASHLKQGIIVRNNTGELLGLVVYTVKGFAIRTTKDEFLGGSDTINQLINRFNQCNFYLL